METKSRKMSDTSSEEEYALDTCWLMQGGSFTTKRSEFGMEDMVSWWKRKRFVNFETGEVLDVKLESTNAQCWKKIGNTALHA